jgi:hypothetical protein
MKPIRDKITTGSAGVFYVAAVLSTHGLIVTLTLRNTRGIDLLASDGTRSVAIQVKTSSTKNREWQLDNKTETQVSSDFLFVFVDLGSPQEVPDFYIVPSKDVSDYCAGHAKWASTAATTDQRKKREGMSLRKFRDKERKYLNRWDILGFPAVNFTQLNTKHGN